MNAGICYLNAINSYTCLCPTNYYGTNCQYSSVNTNPCSSNPCLNGGTCQVVQTGTGACSYVCLCCGGYSGTNCQTTGLSSSLLSSSLLGYNRQGQRQAPQPSSNILNNLFAARPPPMMPQQFMCPNVMQQPFMMNGMYFDGKQEDSKPDGGQQKLEVQQQARQGMVPPPKPLAPPKQPEKSAAKGKGSCVDKDPQFCAWIKSKSPCTENYKVYCPLSCNAC